jgi:hypothetical protein
VLCAVWRVDGIVANDARSSLARINRSELHAGPATVRQQKSRPRFSEVGSSFVVGLLFASLI